MTRYFKYRGWDDFYVYKNNILYSYTSVSTKQPLYRYKSQLPFKDILAAINKKSGALTEISETDFLKAIIIRGVHEYE